MPSSVFKFILLIDKTTKIRLYPILDLRELIDTIRNLTNAFPTFRPPQNGEGEGGAEGNGNVASRPNIFGSLTNSFSGEPSLKRSYYDSNPLTEEADEEENLNDIVEKVEYLQRGLRNLPEEQSENLPNKESFSQR